MLGLFVFFYAALHLATYLWFDQFFDWPAIAGDILKRPFITVGMISFALLLPLAATSNAFAIRKLGGRRWQELHRSVYAIGLLAVLHYSWMVKADISGPLAYAAVLGVLLGLRVWWRVQERNKQLAGAYMPKPRGRVIPIVVRK
jgi:sulfoxide reductase heme-binding subunit YedZ